MDIEKIKSIIDLVKDSGIAEIEITEGDEKLKIATVSTNIAYQTSPISNISNISNNQQASEQLPKVQQEIQSNSKTINSPMVGTFYRSSSPNAAPFIELGKEVIAGQTICIIEAMKLMNHIEADIAGVVKEILVADGAPVEYGQALFRIE